MGNSMGQAIVADIGGTNSRFAIATMGEGSCEISNRWIQASSRFSSLEDALGSYLSTLSPPNIESCCLAVAGPIMGDSVKLTNLGWETSIAAMKREFNFEQFDLINDFSALSYSLPHLDSSVTSILYEGAGENRGVKTIIGPGTGFGVSSVMPTDNGWQLIDGEGGHISFAPVNALEIEILKVLMGRFARVSLETVICGPGLVNLYNALATIRGENAQELSPKDIASMGNTGSDALCQATLQSFCAILGSAAGDIALLTRPLGGMYLGGGILPKIESFLQASEFLSRFLAKEPMSHVVADVPINLVITDDAAFIGAAAALNQI
jgi:glucokinase